jgi:hypothetical protein
LLKLSTLSVFFFVKMTILPLALLTTTHSIFLVILTEEAELAAAIEAEAPAKEAEPRQPTRRRASKRQPTWQRMSGRRSPEVPGGGGLDFWRLEDEVAVVVPPGEEDRDP